jgi:hypothetical protein
VLASDAEEQLPGTDGLPTLGELCRWLTVKRFPLLHIVCHGKYFKGDEMGPAETYLFLHKSGPIDPAKPDDHVERVPAKELIERLGELQGAKTLPHLTFLCSCETASPKAEQGLGGLGQRLVRKLGMPAVVAMTEPISLPLAQQLASEFYQRLGEHGSVAQALDEACAGIADRGEVLIPTLFSRLGGRNLFDESGPLTVGEWEKGLKRLEPLVTERAPMLRHKYEELASSARAALDIRKRTENRPIIDTEAAWALDELRKRLQPDLNELCMDFLEGPFDELARDLPLHVPKYDARCPFPGLGVFDKGEIEDFRPFFFGRRQLTEKVCGLLREHRFLAVLGGSGTGKSSLVRAGVLEQLRKAKPDLQVIIFTPGKDPLGRLQQERVRIPAPDILVVDQFEELFTLCTDANARKAFLAELLPLREQCPVVITMRTDFLAECAEHNELHGLLNSNEKHLELLQPLRGDELRAVVEQQRNAVGLQFEPELAKRIFEDLEHEPGAMPLLQHCLRQLWNYRRGRRLCFADYLSKERVGGVKGAISRTADDVYSKLSPGEQELCPFIFERLVHIDTEGTDPEGRRDTRKREELAQLTPEGGDANLTKTVVAGLANAKLLITTQNPQTKETEVEVAHEALIRHWDKLQRWINSARVTARLVERIRAEAKDYESVPATENLTLRGSILSEAESLLGATPPRLSGTQANFVRACRKAEKERAAARDRLRRRVVTGLALGLVIAIFLGSLAIWQWVLAQRNYATSESRRHDAERQTRLATAQRLAVQADAVAADYPQRSVLLAAEAVQVSLRAGEPPLMVARQSLHQALSRMGGKGLWGHGQMAPNFGFMGNQDVKNVTGVAFGADGHWLATSGADGTLRLWDLTAKNPAPASVVLSDSLRGGVAISQDGHWLATGSEDKTVRLWDL